MSYYSQRRGSFSQELTIFWDNWKVWLVLTVILSTILMFKISIQKIDGIEGNNNDNNKVIISPR
jgi:hypothetical protein